MDQTNQTQPVSPQNNSEPDNGLAVASMVLGIISFLGPMLLTGIPAIILGIMALKRPGGRGFSLTGIITGAITTALSLIGILLFVFLLIIASSTSQEPYPQDDEPIWQEQSTNSQQT